VLESILELDASRLFHVGAVIDCVHRAKQAVVNCVVQKKFQGEALMPLLLAFHLLLPLA